MAKTNSTLDALNALSGQVPGLHQKALKQRQAAQDISLQKAIGAAPATGVTQQAAQPIATQQALQAGQAITDQRKQAMQAAGAIAGDTLKEKQRLAQLDLEQRQMQQAKEQQDQELEQYKTLKIEEAESRQTTLESELLLTEQLTQLGIEYDTSLQIATLKQREDLNRLGIDVKSKLIDSRIQFASDNRGRKFTNERQLADYNLISSKDKQEFNSKMKSIQNAHEQKALIRKQSLAHITSALERGYLKEKGDLDRALEIKLTEMKRKVEQQSKEDANKAANSQAMWKAGGTILFAAGGAALAMTPVGAAIGITSIASGAAGGAVIGGGAGSIAQNTNLNRGR